MSQRKIYFLSALITFIVVVITIVVGKALSPRSTQQPIAAPAPKASENPAFQNWVSVTPISRLYLARFPAGPEREEAEAPIPGSDFTLTQETYTAVDAKGNVYRVVTFLYPTSFENPQAVLEPALQGMVNAVPGNTLVESKAATVDEGISALLFTIQDKEGYYHQGVLLAKGRVLYQAFVTYDNSDITDEEMEYFFDSFELKI